MITTQPRDALPCGRFYEGLENGRMATDGGIDLATLLHLASVGLRYWVGSTKSMNVDRIAVIYPRKRWEKT